MTRLALYLLLAGTYIAILLPYLENNMNSSIRKLEDNAFLCIKADKTEFRNSGNPVRNPLLANKYMLNVNNRNTRRRCELY